MTQIAAVHGVLPPHRYQQAEITEAVAAMCLPPGADRAVLRRLHTSAGSPPVIWRCLSTGTPA